MKHLIDFKGEQVTLEELRTIIGADETNDEETANLLFDNKMDAVKLANRLLDIISLEHNLGYRNVGFQLVANNEVEIGYIVLVAIKLGFFVESDCKPYISSLFEHIKRLKRVRVYFQYNRNVAEDSGVSVDGYYTTNLNPHLKVDDLTETIEKLSIDIKQFERIIEDSEKLTTIYNKSKGKL